MSRYLQPLQVVIAALREEHKCYLADFHGSRKESRSDPIMFKALTQTTPWNYRSRTKTDLTRGDPSHIWLVEFDDRDSFFRGRRGSAVSVAALRDGMPVLGVVLAINWPDGVGDLFAWADGCGPLTLNGQPVARGFSHGQVTQRTVVFLPPDADNDPFASATAVSPARYIQLPSIAHRLARVAAGEGDAAVANEPCDALQYAAGHALVRAAGGVLVDENGTEITYTPDGQSSARLCFGGTESVVRHLLARSWSKRAPVESDNSTPFRLWTPRQSDLRHRNLSRAQGCLLGQLAGDALGGLVEFKEVAEIAGAYPHGVRDLADGGTWGNLAGQPTDDSEMALMLARTLAHHGRYDRGAVLDGYCHWYGRAWDIGGTIGRALRAARLASSTAERLHAVETHADPSRPSNGSLMRISPLGIFSAGRTADGAKWARIESKLTHPSPVCQAACAAYVAALSVAIGFEDTTAEDVYAAALGEAMTNGGSAEVVEVLQAARTERPKDYVTLMGWVLIALQNAFYQLLHAPSLEEGIVDTVMHGGDTDTTGAIAGALLGAVHGVRAIPTRWRTALLSCRTLPASGTHNPQPSEFWPVDALELAEAVFAAGQRDAKQQ